MPGCARGRTCARKRAVNVFRWVFFLISFGSPRVRPVWRTCGEPSEVELTPIWVKLNGSGGVPVDPGTVPFFVRAPVPKRGRYWRSIRCRLAPNMCATSGPSARVGSLTNSKKTPNRNYYRFFLPVTLTPRCATPPACRLRSRAAPWGCLPPVPGWAVPGWVGSLRAGVGARLLPRWER